MTAAPAPRTPVSAGSHRPHSALATWAVTLARVCGGAFAASVAAFALAYTLGEERALEDTWLAMLLFAVPAVGMLGALAAFVLGVVATARHERWAWLWLALGVLPAMIAFVALSEAFLIE